jgi:DNA-binding MarR family transcriptional regulator
MTDRRSKQAARRDPPRGGGKPIDLRRTVTFRLLSTAGKLTQGFINTYTARFGIGLPEWRTLGMLGQFGSLPSIRIAELADMDRGAISRAVAVLERQGLVRRVRDPRHKRRREIVLTAEGRRLHAEVSEFAHWRHARLGELLSHAELSALDSILDKLDQWAEELRAGQDAAEALKPGSERGCEPPVPAPAELSIPAQTRERLLAEIARFRRVLASTA